MKHKVVIAVDPGFGGTGLAMLIDGMLYRFTNVVEKTKEDNRYAELSQKCAALSIEWLYELENRIALYSDKVGIDRVDVVIESPHAMRGVKGIASLLRGDVFKVAKLAGAVGAMIHSYVSHGLNEERANVKLHFPEVRQWKGQLTKTVTRRRVLRDVKYAIKYIKHESYELKEKYPSHIFDAVGLGMWFVSHEVENEN